MSGFAISPWSDPYEFLMVFDSIYQNKDIVDYDYPLLAFGRNKLTIWLVRCQHNLDISVNLMATKEIINALIEDHKSSRNAEPADDETALYSLYGLIFGLKILAMS